MVMGQLKEIQVVGLVVAEGDTNGSPVTKECPDCGPASLSAKYQVYKKGIASRKRYHSILPLFMLLYLLLGVKSLMMKYRAAIIIMICH